jgi:cyanophycinase
MKPPRLFLAWIVLLLPSLCWVICSPGLEAFADTGTEAASAWETAQVELRGSLVIVGGGNLPDTVRDKFLNLAGGKSAKIVVIPTASDTADSKAGEMWKRHGAASVVVLNTKDRSKADEDTFLKPLREATGVWFGGGDQSRLTAAYLGTGVERELRKLLERGGVIGGTSAGAAVMSRIMIAGGKNEAELKDGFGFLPGVILDQHFSQRQRLLRLVDALKKQPGHVGLGIDEQTALIVQKRRLTVLGPGNVTVCLASGGGKSQRVELLKQGSVADLIALRRSALYRALALFPPAKPDEPRLEKGALIIGGGGRLPQEVLKRFITLAGGPDALIVMIPTALEDPVPSDPGEARMLRQAGAKNVKVLHTRNRAEANNQSSLPFSKRRKGYGFPADANGALWMRMKAPPQKKHFMKCLTAAA